MAKDKKSPLTRAKKPDKLVVYGEGFIQFGKTHVVWITAGILAVVVGIVVISKLAHDARLARDAQLREANNLEFAEFYGPLFSPGEKLEDKDIKAADEYVSRVLAFNDKNAKEDDAPAKLIIISGDYLLRLAVEYNNAQYAQDALDAYRRVQDKFSDSPIAGAIDPVTSENILAGRIREAEKILNQLQQIVALFDPEGLWHAPAPPESEP